MKNYNLAKVCAFALSAVFLAVILFGEDSFDAKIELRQILRSNQNTMGDLLAALPTVIARHGVVAAELLTKEAFQQGAINLGQCHDLLHTTGHYAYSFHKRDLKRIAQDNLLICGNAYQHGVEAEIVVSSEDATRELREFCGVLQVGKPYATCYHGAGHAIMYDTHDVEQSLRYCERLNGVPTKESIDDCHAGVFSEYTAASGEMDGHTGLHLAGGSYAKLPSDRPLDFCRTLSPEYHSACASQVSRMVYRLYLPEDALKQCVTGDYPDDIKGACLRTVSALIARRELYQNGNIDMPSFVASLPERFREEYIWGIALEFWMLRDSGVGRDDKKVCALFRIESDRDYCTRLLNSR